MKRLFLVVAFCLFLGPSTVYACSCATGNPALEFNEARMVFIGRMLGGTEKITINDGESKSHVIEAGDVRFAVEEVFKGTEVEQITIAIASMNGTSCGPYGLRRGVRYLVYGYGRKDDEKVLYTGVCTRTKDVSIERAKEDLEFLRNLPPRGVGGNLHGTIWADLRGTGGRTTSPPPVRVKITGPDAQTIIAFTDAKGEFRVAQLKPGRYKVEPEFPPNYTSKNLFAEVDVDDRGTAAVGFETYIDGSVAGRMIDREGNSFNSVFLHMVGDGKTVYGHSTGENGEFEVEGAPPGEYVLYIDMQHEDYTKRKPYYYPGTFDRAKATVIRLGLGEKVEGLEFPLPKGSLVRTLEGEVVWKDGTPAANVDVMLLCPLSSTPGGLTIEFSAPRTKTDDQGRFRIEGFTGQTYWLEARGSREDKERKLVHSVSRKISLTDNIKNVKVTLTEVGFSRRCGEK